MGSDATYLADPIRPIGPGLIQPIAQAPGEQRPARDSCRRQQRQQSPAATATGQSNQDQTTEPDHECPGGPAGDGLAVEPPRGQ